jgi:DNA-binding NtrC family response regulator
VLQTASVGLVILDLQIPESDSDRVMENADSGKRLLRELVDRSLHVLVWSRWANWRRPELQTLIRELHQLQAHDVFFKNDLDFSDDELGDEEERFLYKVQLLLGCAQIWPSRRTDAIGAAEAKDSPAMHDIHALADKAAATDATILILGESGVGKEVLARRIHNASGRDNRPFIHINCAAIPKDLLEGELFGHEAGAFTDAKKRTSGLFELARNGTIFLDEIGEMPYFLQAKLNVVLEERKVRRLGSSQEYDYTLQARIIAATNRNIQQEIAKASFREDLFYRLNTICLEIPPLRERRDEIIPVARNVLFVYANRHRSKARSFAPEAETALLAYDWPGNLRQLDHVVERAVIVAMEREIVVVEDLPSQVWHADVKTGRRPPTLGTSAAAPTSDIPRLPARLPSKEELASRLQRELILDWPREDRLCALLVFQGKRNTLAQFAHAHMPQQINIRYTNFNSLEAKFSAVMHSEREWHLDVLQAWVNTVGNRATLDDLAEKVGADTAGLRRLWEWLKSD